MSRRKIGQEIIQGLAEIKAWRRGELKLKTYTVEMLKAGIRNELGLSQPELAGFFETAKPALRTGRHKIARKHIPTSTRAKRVT